MSDLNLTRVIEEHEKAMTGGTHPLLDDEPFYGAEAREDLRRFMLDMNVDGMHIPDDPAEWTEA